PSLRGPPPPTARVSSAVLIAPPHATSHLKPDASVQSSKSVAHLFSTRRLGCSPTQPVGGNGPTSCDSTREGHRWLARDRSRCGWPAEAFPWSSSAPRAPAPID